MGRIIILGLTVILKGISILIKEFILIIARAIRCIFEDFLKY